MISSATWQWRQTRFLDHSRAEGNGPPPCIPTTSPKRPRGAAHSPASSRMRNVATPTASGRRWLQPAGGAGPAGAAAFKGGAGAAVRSRPRASGHSVFCLRLPSLTAPSCRRPLPSALSLSLFLSLPSAGPPCRSRAAARTARPA